MEKTQEQQVKGIRKENKDTSKIIRIMQTDVPGEKKVYVGLTRIKGVSWSFSNAVCYKLNIDKNKKVESLKEDEIQKIEKFIQNPELPAFLLNRRKDFDTGENKHAITTDLELKEEFDIKRLKKIRSYRGLRHALGQPTRGQRTKSHFRQKGKSMGVVKKAKVGKKS
jgi:small subunit ribosomal protein S13